MERVQDEELGIREQALEALKKEISQGKMAKTLFFFFYRGVV